LDIHLHRPMHEEKIQIVHTEVLERLIERRFYIFRRMLCIPELPSKEDFRSWHAAPSDTVAYFGLIAIDGGAIDVPVAIFQGRFDSALNLARLSLPCPKPNRGYLSTSIERKMCGKWHG
jgi:hypothetical protein